MYQIRKCQTITIVSKTQTINLDPENFRNLSLPYEGNSEEEFVKYINGIDFNQLYEENSLSQELDQQSVLELNKFYEDAEWEDFYNSSFDAEESWLEIGEENISFTRTGGFEARHSTASDY